MRIAFVSPNQAHSRVRIGGRAQGFTDAYNASRNHLIEGRRRSERASELFACGFREPSYENTHALPKVNVLPHDRD